MDRRDFIAATTKAVAAVTLGLGNCVDDFLEPRRSYFFIQKGTQLYFSTRYAELLLNFHYQGIVRDVLNSSTLLQPRDALKWHVNPWKVSPALSTPAKTVVMHSRYATSIVMDEIPGAGEPIMWNPSPKVGRRIYGESLLDAIASMQTRLK